MGMFMTMYGSILFSNYYAYYRHGLGRISARSAYARFVMVWLVKLTYYMEHHIQDKAWQVLLYEIMISDHVSFAANSCPMLVCSVSRAFVTEKLIFL